MKKEYNIFLKNLKESREKSVLFILNLIKENKASLKDIYFELLIPAMKELRLEQEKNKAKNWENALIASRLKTAIECTYPYILKQKEKPINKKVLVVTSTGEEEQVGALIASHIFLLAGFETVYIDSSISQDEILLALSKYKPDYLTFGLKNFYNTFETRNTIDNVLKKYNDIKILVGGPVFKKEDVQNSLTYHYFIKYYTEIFDIAKEVKNETSIKDSK